MVKNLLAVMAKASPAARLGLVGFLAVLVWSASVQAGGTDWRAERRQAAGEARDLSQNLGRQFTLLSQSFDGALVDCKGKVSLWQVSMTLGSGAPALPGGRQREIAACLEGARSRLATGVDEILRSAPSTYRLTVAIHDYRVAGLDMIDDFLPRRSGDRHENATDYDRRWQRTRDAISDKAAAVEAAIAAIHP